MRYFTSGTIDEQIARMRTRIAKGLSNTFPPLPGYRHEILITMKDPVKGILNVRCRCGSVSRRPRYHNFDVIGTATTIEEAKEVYRNHVEESDRVT